MDTQGRIEGMGEGSTHYVLQHYVEENGVVTQ
jgi:hypothetical protein